MRKRIALISEHASPMAAPGGVDSGGQNVYVAEVAKALAILGYEIDVFTRRDSKHLSTIADFAPGVRIIHVDAGPAKQIPKEEILSYMDEFSSQVLAFTIREKLLYQLVHANFFMSGIVAMRLKKELTIPFVITFHALGKVRRIHQKEQDLFPLERLNIETELVQMADRIIAECPQDEEDLINHYQADPSKISIVPCGFNPEEFYPIDKAISREALGLPIYQPLILQLGRMVPRKGVDTVIEAIQYLDDLPDAKLIIVGGEKEQAELDDCAEMRRLRALASSLGVSDKIIFAGRKNRDQLNMYYDAADVFVTTPWYEPFGITPLEAMGCATPVIGAEVGGIKYSVIDGETGFLIPPKSPKELAEKLKVILADKELQQKMGNNALARVIEHFTWQKVAGQIAKLYEEVMLATRQDQSKAIAFINAAFEDAAQTFRNSANVLNKALADAACCLTNALKNGFKILVCGNGGSAAESQHFAAELVGRFEIKQRKGLPAISLTADTSILTAWANDFGYDDVFARQVEAYGQPGDVLLCLSTSGTSPNIVKALQKANSIGLKTITMLGRDGGTAAAFGAINLVVPSESSQRIQEVHLHLVHLLCGLIEDSLFNTPSAKTVITNEKQYASQQVDQLTIEV